MPADSSRSNPTETLIAAFGGIRPMAKKLKIPVTTIQGWKKRQAIPLNRHDEIEAGAQKLNITLEPGLLASTAPEDSSGPKSEDKTNTSTPAAKTPVVANAVAAVTNKPIVSKPVDQKASDGKASDSKPAPKKPAGEKSADQKQVADKPTETPKPTSTTALEREKADEASPTATDRMRAAKQQATLKQQEAGGASSAPPMAAGAHNSTEKAQDSTQQTAGGRKGGGFALFVACLALICAITAPFWAPLAAKYLTIELPGQPAAIEIAALSTQLRELRGDLENMSDQLATRNDRQIEAVRQQLNDQITNLDQRIGNLDLAAGSGNPQAIERLRRDIGRDLAPLASAIDDLSGRLDGMEAGGTGRPSRQVSLVLAVGNLASAVRTSSAYDTELGTIPSLLPPGAGASDLIATLEAHAETGVPTAAQLTQDFADEVGPALQAIHLNDEQSTLDQALGQLRALITVRRSPGEVEGDDPPALLARAEHRLRNGDVAGAYSLTDRLPEAAQASLSEWRNRALARITVDEAIDQLIGLAASTSAGGQ